MTQAMAEPDKSHDLARRRRLRNYALGGVLLAFVVIVYLVSIVRMGGG